VLSPSQEWEGSLIVSPKVIKVESTYHLWYQGGSPPHYDIGYATTQDGITWNKYEGNPVMANLDHLLPSQIIFQDNIFKMWYAQGQKINLAVSYDGIEWTDFEGNPVLETGEVGSWDVSWLTDCAIIEYDTMYKMWYSGGDLSNITYGIGYATSTPHTHDIAVSSIFDSIRSLPTYCYTSIIPKANILNIGLSGEHDVTVNCTFDSAGYLVFNNTQTIDTLQRGTLISREIEFDPWFLKRDSECTYNVTYNTSLANDQNLQNDTMTTTISISKMIDDFESGFYKWSPDSCWVLFPTSVGSGTGCLRNTDKPNYDTGVDSWVEFKFPFDLSSLDSAHISYSTKYFIENGKDFGYVEASNDGGLNWTQLGESYTGMQAVWTDNDRSLDNFCGPGFDNVKLRFRFVSDSVTTPPSLGWYIDNIKIFPTSESTAIISHNVDNVPKSYTLSNNYPNPFNGSTIIKYTLPEQASVNITIYNLLGQKVIRLVDKMQQPGEYSLLWQGDDWSGTPVPSGVYVYKMQTKNFTVTKKMLYIK